ncbi:transcription initiation factor TFIIE subunit alpha [Marchantia polymorpha subsp. ruderalis]|uniref:HTH TFE/IIEalpha-type domain-containing protein n=2 Tax=Marchantia polymorpha TaxID=3197 RepID=A0A176WMA8_MARPO|nr:hypothetical protein AXG93_3891s1170 [Marchantia polymorpha subsp. ruderalis]PTQ39250.1 hypothetical protein MARPO_0046s0071 [Marchantia polymorpha]BBN15758.1 hypothetical protein Mp_7g00540 [Marchantia polymorpha subsp. ruderalis]|eukprot:PTQ39250.1 hypothetical protein MARPO_0046s0071 [Marchantia polymorpha]
MSIEPFRRLVKLVARAFYDEEIPPKGANRSKSDKSDNRGIAVVILDALTRRQWVKEEDLARDLRLHPKQLRRTLRVLEEELLILREHRRETVKGAKVYNAAIAAVSEQPSEREGEEKPKVHTHSYCCLDYAQVFDIVRYRIHRSKKKIKDELEDRNTVQEYICPAASCGRRYSALDALRLINVFDGNFHCELCDGELVAESDKLAAAELGDGDGEENARRRRREKLKELYEKLEKQLKPLQDQLTRVKDLAPPDFGSLEAWEKRAIAAGRIPGNDASTSDLPKPSHGQGPSGTPMPFLGETKVEVALAGGDTKKDEGKEEAAQLKVLPPWMIRQGMTLTASQRGEAKSEVKTEDGASLAGPDTKDVKPAEEDKEEQARKIQEEYLKAYYAALLARQQGAEQPTAQPEPVETGAEAADGVEETGERQVGMKAKREDGDEGEAEEDEDVEWEHAAAAEPVEPVVASQDSQFSNVGDPDPAPDPGGEFDDDDDVDWEEG